MKAIGIDIGTTTISGVVLDVDQHLVTEARTVENGSFINTKHSWERIQDVDVILAKAGKLVEELRDICPEADAIGLTGQMHGIVYVDKNGRHVSPLYTWQDGRGSLPSEDGRCLTKKAEDTTGILAATGYGLISHLYNLQQGLVPEGAVSVCTIADYLGMVLTDRTRPLMHVSNAASLGFFDSRIGAFRIEALKALGIAPDILPDVTEEIEVLG
ncbi:MAG: hypothetical protein LIO94_09005, partial [Clostridiales bacterium]|nr:hypothetical protein [Clostridiales bacterium]